MKLLILTLWSLFWVSPSAFAAFNGADVKSCALTTTASHVYRWDKKPDAIYVFKGAEIFRVTLPSTDSFSIPAISKTQCYTAAGPTEETDCKPSTRPVVKLDGVAFNEAYGAIMTEYADQARAMMDVEGDAIQMQKSEATTLGNRLHACSNLGPLTPDARKALHDAQAAMEMMNEIYGIASKEETKTATNTSGSKTKSTQ